MKVKEIMNSPVTACSITSDIWDVKSLMETKGYSAIPVVHMKGDKIEIKGIVSYKDLAVMDDSINIQQAMSHTVETVTPDTNLKEAAQLMVRKKLHHLVVTENGEIKGMLSSMEFVKLYAE